MAPKESAADTRRLLDQVCRIYEDEPKDEKKEKNV